MKHEPIPVTLREAMEERLKLQTDLIITLIMENEHLKRQLKFSREANQVLSDKVLSKN